MKKKKPSNKFKSNGEQKRKRKKERQKEREKERENERKEKKNGGETNGGGRCGINGTMDGLHHVDICPESNRLAQVGIREAFLAAIHRHSSLWPLTRYHSVGAGGEFVNASPPPPPPPLPPPPRKTFLPPLASILIASPSVHRATGTSGTGSPGEDGANRTAPIGWGWGR